MKFFLIYFLILVFSKIGWTFSNCKNLNTVAGNLEIDDKTMDVKIDNYVLKGEINTKTKVESGQYFRVLSDKASITTSNFLSYYEYQIMRDSNNHPTKIIITPAVSNTTTGFGGPRQPKTNYEFSFNFDNKNNCSLDRLIRNGSHILYDISLCKKLSESLNKITKEDLTKCSNIISEMSKSIEKFKTDIKNKSLTLDSGLGENPYQSALLYAASCRFRLKGMVDRMDSLEVPMEEGQSK